MDTQQTQIYHMIKLLLTYGDLQNGVHCVPDSWIRMRDPESALVLVAFPHANEPLSITAERVKNYENSGEDWNLCMAEIMYNTNYYPSVIRSLRDECGKEETCTNSESFDNSILGKLSRKDEIGRSSSFQMEYYKWLCEQSNSDSSGLSIDDSLQSEGSEHLKQDIDRNYVPLDLSSRFRESDKNQEDINIMYGTANYLCADKR